MATDLPPFDWANARPRERLAYLATALDNEQAWRDKVMHWHYGTVYIEESCGSTGCALGLMAALWKKDAPPRRKGALWVVYDDVVAEMLGITTEQVWHLFYCSADYHTPPFSFEGTQPSDVAAEIRLFLEDSNA